MKLKVTCSRCEAEVLVRGTPDAVIGISGMLSLTPKPYHSWTCQHGHRNWIWLAHPFHELLIYRGIQELATADTRAAVMSLYSAWDNFLLFWVREMHSASDPTQAPPKALLRSEPVVGLFSGLYWSAVGRWPRLVRDASRGMRNRVAHDMLVPTTEEAYSLGTDVLQCIREALEPFLERYESWIGGDAAHQRMLAAIETAPPEVDKSLIALGLERSFAAEDLREAVPRAETLDVGRVLWWSGR